MPSSQFKTFWNIIVILLLLYTSTVVPYQVAFVDEDTLMMTAFNGLVDVLFGVDIVVNFFSAYEANNQTVTSLPAIARNYCQLCPPGWFYLDFVATIPTQVFTAIISAFSEGGGRGGVNKLIRLARLPRLYRLMRLMRIFKVLKSLKYNKRFNEIFGFIKIQASKQKMLGLLIGGFFLIHLFACFWYLTAKFDEFNPDTWVARKGLAGVGDFNELYTATVQKYVESLYWALQVLTTIGYGDFGAATTAEYILNLVWMFLGVAYYQVVFGQIISIMTASTSSENILNVSLTSPAHCRHRPNSRHSRSSRRRHSSRTSCS